MIVWYSEGNNIRASGDRCSYISKKNVPRSITTWTPLAIHHKSGSFTNKLLTFRAYFLVLSVSHVSPDNLRFIPVHLHAPPNKTVVSPVKLRGLGEGGIVLRKRIDV